MRPRVPVCGHRADEEVRPNDPLRRADSRPVKPAARVEGHLEYLHWAAIRLLLRQASLYLHGLL